MKPVQKFASGAIAATVWNNVTPEKKEYQTITFERRYKDKDGSWKSSNSLRVNDLPKAALVLNRAYEFLVFKQNDNAMPASPEEVVY